MIWCIPDRSFRLAQRVCRVKAKVGEAVRIKPAEGPALAPEVERGSEPRDRTGASGGRDARGGEGAERHGLSPFLVIRRDGFINFLEHMERHELFVK